MQRTLSTLAAIWLAAMIAETARAGDAWTWTGAVPAGWTSANWSCNGSGCAGRTYPNLATDKVTISGVNSHVTIDVPLITIGALTLSDQADLTVPLLLQAVHVLRIMDEAGLQLDGDSTEMLIEGGEVRLSGGGDVRIADTDDTTAIIFQSVEDGRLVFEGMKAYTIVRDTAANGGMIHDSIRTNGVHGIIDGGIGAGEDEVVMLFEGRIKGNLTITAQLINAGEVINDENDLAKPLTLCGRPKMGSGLWRAGREVSPSQAVTGKLVADTIVVGDSCSLLDVQLGTIDLNTFWLSAGRLEMHELRLATDPPTRVEVAAGKIMQFGRKIYCPCDSG